MAIPRVSAYTSAAKAGAGPPDVETTETTAFCQCCQVACHRFRPTKPCSFCHARVCQFCSCGTEPHVLCKSCQPQVRGAQPAFSFRQLLWRFKMLPFGCHGEKWLFLVRKRQSFVVPTDLTGDEYQWLVHQLPRQRRLQGAHLEQKRTLDRDVDRTFQQLQIRMANAKRANFLAKSQYSSSEFMTWKSNTHQLLSVFLMLKPQIGYCQGMTSVAAVLVQESKMNSEIAFRLFLALSEKYRLDDVYRPDMKDVNLRYFQLDEALRLHLPRLHAHLSDRDIHPSTYASCWILTLFTECRLFPHRYVVAFLDLFFEFGWKVFFQTCLAIFSIIETPLLRQSTPGEIFAYLSKVTWFHRHKSDSDLDRFFATARAVNISSSFLDVLQGEYSTEASMSMNEYD
ncbi:ecotropic viral integration site [Phytophthora pseudosyringae]|uniref:Ecotropic viral integration site n=1 Tax=Phytophthora pseudosyringae TaxID=221518 RepID=A0A8T1WJK1_9STRA|nr:ecotropic viral integration site [Phytophthora pseudosyringae]